MGAVVAGRTINQFVFPHEAKVCWWFSAVVLVVSWLLMLAASAFGMTMALQWLLSAGDLEVGGTFLFALSLFLICAATAASGVGYRWPAKLPWPFGPMVNLLATPGVRLVSRIPSHLAQARATPLKSVDEVLFRKLVHRLEDMGLTGTRRPTLWVTLVAGQPGEAIQSWSRSHILLDKELVEDRTPAGRERLDFVFLHEVGHVVNHDLLPQAMSVALLPPVTVFFLGLTALGLGCVLFGTGWSLVGMGATGVLTAASVYLVMRYAGSRLEVDADLRADWFMGLPYGADAFGGMPPPRWGAAVRKGVVSRFFDVMRTLLGTHPPPEVRDAYRLAARKGILRTDLVVALLGGYTTPVFLCLLEQLPGALLPESATLWTSNLLGNWSALAWGLFLIRPLSGRMSRTLANAMLLGLAFALGEAVALQLGALVAWVGGAEQVWNPMANPAGRYSLRFVYMLWYAAMVHLAFTSRPTPARVRRILWTMVLAAPVLTMLPVLLATLANKLPFLFPGLFVSGPERELAILLATIDSRQGWRIAIEVALFAIILYSAISFIYALILVPKCPWCGHRFPRKKTRVEDAVPTARCDECERLIYDAWFSGGNGGARS